MIKLINEERLAELLIKEARLSALDAGGVNSWSGLHHCINYTNEGKFYRDLLNKTNSEITSKFKDA